MILEVLYITPMVITIAGASYLRYKNGSEAFSRAELLMVCMGGLMPLLNLVTMGGVIIDLNEPYKDWWNS